MDLSLASQSGTLLSEAPLPGNMQISPVADGPDNGEVDLAGYQAFVMLSVLPALPPQWNSPERRRKKKKWKQWRPEEEPKILLGAVSITAFLPTMSWEVPLPNLNLAGFIPEITATSYRQVPQAHIASIVQLTLATSPFWEFCRANKGARAVWDAIPRIPRALKKRTPAFKALILAAFSAGAPCFTCFACHA